MALHDIVFQAESNSRRLEWPRCPCCGETPFLPQTAEFAGDYRVRHNWLCENCGHPFQTVVRVVRKNRSQSDTRPKGQA
jgi:hypothetical protein